MRFIRAPVRHSADSTRHAGGHTIRTATNEVSRLQDVLSQLPPLLLVGAYVFFWAWEGAGAARSAGKTPGRRARNIAISLASFAIAGASGAALLAVSALTTERQWGLLAMAGGQIPAAAIVGLGMLAADLTDYWRHRVSHAVPGLWRLHRVHHSDTAIDVTTSLRNHPIEMMLRPLFLSVGVVAFGIPPLSLVLLTLLQLPVLVFQHANIALPAWLDRAIALVVVTPGMHLVHHSRAAPQTNSNYATCLSLWDRLFFTFRRGMPETLGLDGHDGPRHQSLVGMLATPWR
jgi:sterol desaturase/sphingolipid hydroxylase (fatty acid hydroxylase superfamily)